MAEPQSDYDRLSKQDKQIVDSLVLNVVRQNLAELDPTCAKELTLESLKKMRDNMLAEQGNGWLYTLRGSLIETGQLNAAKNDPRFKIDPSVMNGLQASDISDAELGGLAYQKHVDPAGRPVNKGACVS